ncbi:LOW QUALITY PROTEIN: probable tubulin polyglutamylase TTLL9 [Haliotis rubra]|uniref:LOW QUALITY PROTEIN: probable tubulin polyglutamylase TTLL9 n=1 Tax=Haliotis rubra TaxID=36100 RepID=UPI001EE502A3|nr:LOW QUALITY PROTEIN: probable tubulin polyglutamylase TTLL9 [Haliotis rubra]
MNSKPGTSKITGQSRYPRPRAVITDREIRYRCSLQNTISEVLRDRPGWQEVIGYCDCDWDFYWCDREWLHQNYDTTFLHEHQRILHFRNHYELTRKNLMVKNLKRLRKQVEREHGKLEAQSFDFYPTTYELPSEYHIFVEEFKKSPGVVWIMKPAAKSQGKGIFLFRKLKDIMDWRKGQYQPVSDPNIREGPELYVVQPYIEDPYLIGGRKFDIRVYVLVLSYNPLKVWLYRDGFARFSNTRFSLDSIEDAYVHLTNVAVQKTAPDYDPERGCKWSTRQLRKYLSAKHGDEDVKNLFKNIDNMIIKCLQSVQKIMINDKHCFEMYGYDVLLDSQLKPWLIEINASPSLTASGKDDYDLKYGLLTDLLNVLDLENRLTGREKRIGGWDLLWDDGPVAADEGNMDCNGGTSVYNANSFLGCQNERKSQLREMFKVAQMVKRPQ